MIGEGLFRSDLFYRLNVFPMQVPALRDRREDIPALVRHFVERFALRMKRHITTIPPSTMDALQRAYWPGNIRELENVIERAVILSPGPTLQVPLSDLQPASPRGPVESSAAVSHLRNADRELILRALRDCNGVVGGPSGAATKLGLKRTTLQSMMGKLGITRHSGH